jgi:hypothetical protein
MDANKQEQSEVERLREEITEKNLELGSLRVEVEKLKDTLMEFYTPEMPDSMLELLKSRL